MFDHFVGLALKGLYSTKNLVTILSRLRSRHSRLDMLLKEKSDLKTQLWRHFAMFFFFTRCLHQFLKHCKEALQRCAHNFLHVSGLEVNEFNSPAGKYFSSFKLSIITRLTHYTPQLPSYRNKSIDLKSKSIDWLASM